MCRLAENGAGQEENQGRRRRAGTTQKLQFTPNHISRSQNGLHQQASPFFNVLFLKETAMSNSQLSSAQWVPRAIGFLRWLLFFPTGKIKDRRQTGHQSPGVALSAGGDFFHLSFIGCQPINWEPMRVRSQHPEMESGGHQNGHLAENRLHRKANSQCPRTRTLGKCGRVNSSTYRFISCQPIDCEPMRVCAHTNANLPRAVAFEQTL